MTAVVRPLQEDAVFANLNYVRNAPRAGEPGLTFHTDDASQTTILVAPGRRVAITNARPTQDAFSLERNGFQLCRLETEVRAFRHLESDVELAAVYCGEIENLLLELTGGALAVVRRDSLKARYGGEGERADLPNAAPVRFVHADNTDASSAARALQSSVDQLQANGVAFEPDEFSRYAFYNVWRCFSPAPQDIPLAVCDARTVDSADEVTVTTVSMTAGEEDIVHDATGYRYNPKHRWYYFRDMAANEVLVFKQHDSVRILRRVPHAAFDDPSCPRGVPSRSSIELRAAVFFK